jgi:hypothetical protein
MIKPIKTSTSTLYKCCKYAFLLGTGFWIGETLFFLMLYGWHWHAFNSAELTCDRIVTVFWGIASIFLFYLIIEAGRITGQEEQFSEGQRVRLVAGYPCDIAVKARREMVHGTVQGISNRRATLGCIIVLWDGFRQERYMSPNDISSNVFADGYQPP